MHHHVAPSNDRITVLITEKSMLQYFQPFLFSCLRRWAVAIAVALVSAQGSFAQEASSPIAGESLQQLDLRVASYVQEDRAVGAELLVLENRKVLLHVAHGFSDREQKQPWQKNTLCNIRSMTKSITSAAAQLLIDRGLLKLNEPVATYLDSFDNERCREITVRHVLTHRSGFPLTLLLAPRQYKSLAEQVDAYAVPGPASAPGETFTYSDAGADVVGRLVAKVAGESLDAFVQREILTPLGMKNSFYGIDGYEQRLQHAANLYLGKTKGWHRFWKPENGALYPFAWGSQTLYSTTTDYAKFLAMVSDGGRVGDRQILSQAAIERMLEPVSPVTIPGTDVAAPTGFRGVKQHYGQMMVTYRSSELTGKQAGKELELLGHSGSDGTCGWAWPDRNLIVIYFTQSRGGRTPLRMEEALDQWLIHPGTGDRAIPEHLRPYLGSYIANFKQFKDEEFVVRARDGKLILDVPSQMAFELLAPDENRRWAFALAPEKIQVTFSRDDKNRVVALRLHQGGDEYLVPRK